MTKVKVIGAYVNGKGPGSIVDVDEKTALYLEKIGYGEITKVEEPKEEPKTDTKESKPKKATKKKTKSKDE